MRVGLGSIRTRSDSDLLCSNFTLEGKTLVPELRRPFSLLAEGLLVGGEGIGGGGGNRTLRPDESPTDVTPGTSDSCLREDGRPEERLCHADCHAAQKDPDLARFVEAWTALPDSVRAAVLAVVATAQPGPDDPKA